MKARTIDFIGGCSLQIGCLIGAFLGAPSWITPISIFVGMWWAIGIYRSIYDRIKKRWFNSSKPTTQEPKQ